MITLEYIFILFDQDIVKDKHMLYYLDSCTYLFNDTMFYNLDEIYTIVKKNIKNIICYNQLTL